MASKRIKISAAYSDFQKQIRGLRSFDKINLNMNKKPIILIIPLLIIASVASYFYINKADEKYRGKGYGRLMVDHVKKLAKARGCKAIILDSGMPRKAAHTFYEKYGFEKSCYGFESFLE